ncbi:protein unc-93 homolog A-like [Haliotis asinina]|uniref:protein unc-93 homolog A-like n=1 Tax=Haliotis asinina TaxID=109174 RepID=UPI00353277F4
MSLTPWDFSGLGMGFGLYRPRRPSYTFATQCSRQRSESYRYATRRETDIAEQSEDFIDDMMRKKRKASYIKATRKMDEIELDNVINENRNHVGNDTREQNHVCQKHNVKEVVIEENSKTPEPYEDPEEPTPSSSEQGSSIPSIIMFTFKKNLIVLCASFILIFSSFRAIQNLQSSVNTASNLGIITMSCVHGTTVLTCLLAPVVINIFSAKWSLALGMLCYLIWFGANFYPRFYTLIPTALLAGLGQGILWTAEISYVLKLAFDSARVTKDLLEHEMFRFHGIFLACFQTTHIWGNLISSILIGQKPKPVSSFGNTSMFPDGMIKIPDCGVLHRCQTNKFMEEDSVSKFSGVLWKLMCSYIVLGFIGFLLIVILLDRIGARIDTESSGYQMLVDHVSQMVTHKTFRLLIPLLIFTGLQQGFMYSDFNQHYVTCTLGEEYVGYTMITMGICSMLGSILVALTGKRIPREVVLGFGGIMHIALMIGFLIWIPDNHPVLFFVLAGAWGVCDAVWQTQCNTLICLTCVDEPDIAFANYRLLQSLGLTIAFCCGTFMCVSAKLYMLMTMLVVAIMFYVLAEYRVRHVDEDDVFEDHN